MWSVFYKKNRRKKSELDGNGETTDSDNFVSIFDNPNHSKPTTTFLSIPSVCRGKKINHLHLYSSQQQPFITSQPSALLYFCSKPATRDAFSRCCPRSDIRPRHPLFFGEVGVFLSKHSPFSHHCYSQPCHHLRLPSKMN